MRRMRLGDMVGTKAAKGETQNVASLDDNQSAHIVLQPPNWPRPRGYSNGILAEGRIVVTGGVVGWNEEGVFAASFIEQARQTLLNIKAILAEAGAGPEHLVRLTWYVTDMDEYTSEPKALGRVYREIFGRAFPAMAALQVVRLVEPRAKIEIEATAVIPVSET
jgi:enamine deaminase RidA (YjgF/YER057c/UK114 family)